MFAVFWMMVGFVRHFVFPESSGRKPSVADNEMGGGRIKQRRGLKPLEVAWMQGSKAAVGNAFASAGAGGGALIKWKAWDGRLRRQAQYALQGGVSVPRREDRAELSV